MKIGELNLFSNNNSKELVSIKYEVMNRRNAFRIYPEPVSLSLHLLGQEVEIINISSSGVAFTLKPGNQLQEVLRTEIHGVLSLREFDTNPIPIKLQVTQKKNGVYHCQTQLPRRGFNTLCSYIMKKQIQDIRKLQKSLST